MAKWVTRERPKTDRIACPWLIQNFIDAEAEFLYVPAGQVLEVAEREGASSYDAPGARVHPPRRTLLVRGARRGARDRRPCGQAAGSDRARRRRLRGSRRDAGVARAARGRGGVPPARAWRPPPARAQPAGLRRALRLVQEPRSQPREPRSGSDSSQCRPVRSPASTTPTCTARHGGCTSHTPEPIASMSSTASDRPSCGRFPTCPASPAS